MELGGASRRAFLQHARYHPIDAGDAPVSRHERLTGKDNSRPLHDQIKDDGSAAAAPLAG